MSRAKATDVSSPISLFPFIGVLLSTMGALLVVLIAVSRSAHDAAVREVAAKRTAAAAAGQDDSRQKLQQVSDYVAQLKTIRAEAEKRLHDDQLQLSHVEDHTRRLKEQFDALQRSVNELVALDGEHYDDRKQAEREIERLGQLIQSTRDAITDQQNENKTKKRSYAIVPYEGQHGTTRRPIYIECRQDEVVLQPEGIHLTPEDFRPPLGAGNPLASALRAAREYIVRQEGTPGPNNETLPYPLILVRPDGIMAYYRVRDAIESWDSDFGYELVENDWKLEYPATNPLLAELEQQAVQHSRSRQQMLVAAAPRAYGARQMAGGGGFGDDEESGGGDEGEDGQFSDEGGGGRGGGFGSGQGGGYGSGSGGGFGNGSGGQYATDAGASGTHGEYAAVGLPSGEGGGPALGASGDPHAGGGAGYSDSGGSSGTGTGDGTGVAGGGATNGTSAPGAGGVAGATGNGVGGMSSGAGQQSGNSINIAGGSATGGATNSHGSAPPLAPSATGSSLSNGVGEAPLAAADRSVGGAAGVRAPSAGSRSSSDEPSERTPLDMQMNVQQRIPASARGQNWAIKGKGPTSVPIRRTIRVVVRNDRLSLEPDSLQTATRNVAGKEIPLQGQTVARLDDFVHAVQDRVHEWGLAGSGMYWRPVLLLDVGPDGQARADDLTRLLRNSGIEVQSDATAARPQEGGANATR